MTQLYIVICILPSEQFFLMITRHRPFASKIYQDILDFGTAQICIFNNHCTFSRKVIRIFQTLEQPRFVHLITIPLRYVIVYVVMRVKYPMLEMNYGCYDLYSTPILFPTVQLWERSLAHCCSSHKLSNTAGREHLCGATRVIKCNRLDLMSHTNSNV